MKMLQLIWYRLLSETPGFFKKIFIFMASLAGLSGSLLLLKEQLPVEMHELIDTWAGRFLIASTVGAFFSKLPTKDPGLQENELPLKKRKAKR